MKYKYCSDPELSNSFIPQHAHVLVLPTKWMLHFRSMKHILYGDNRLLK